ncbi:MAG: TolC family protein [Prolixibacteraceae bacterium]
MKLIPRLFAAMVVMFALHLSTLAQEPVVSVAIAEEIENLLPPLHAIIDTALSRNLDIKAKDHVVTAREYNLKTERRRWTENIGIQADARYGTFDNFALNTIVGVTPTNLTTRTNQMNYGIGAFLKIPFFEIATRKNTIGSYKAQVDQAVSEAGVQRDLIRQAVIKQYHEVVLKHKILRIRSKYLETARINVQMGESDFHSGKTNINEYARIADFAAIAEVNFESAKSEFITSYLILEEIAKTKFKLH